MKQRKVAGTGPDEAEKGGQDRTKQRKAGGTGPDEAKRRSTAQCGMSMENAFVTKL